MRAPSQGFHGPERLEKALQPPCTGPLYPQCAQRELPGRTGASLEHTVGCFVGETVRTCGAAACAANCSVFLTTDSGQAQALFVAAMAPHGIRVVASIGAISHLEHSAINASEHMKTFADWCSATAHLICVAHVSQWSLEVLVDHRQSELTVQTNL